MSTSTPSLRRFIKSGARRLLRRVGIDARSYHPGSSREAQFQAALQHFAPSFVVDVGANTGQFGLELIEFGHAGPILSVEPQPDAHARLQQTARAWPNWQVAPCLALGAEAGQIEFHVAANSVSSSALPVAHSSVEAEPASRQVSTRTVDVITLAELLRRHPLPASGGLLKVDTQGYEWQVLDGAPQGLAPFDTVLLELSLQEIYLGQRLWRDLVDRMEAFGFGLWMLQPEFVDPRHGRTLQMNGLFFRDPTRPARA